MNTWFRMYSEFADDPKVQMMPEVMQRRFVMLLCERCKCETLHETERAFHWRISETELAQTKALFIEKGFIDDDWNLINWNKRQFISDSSTDRVRKHRQALKQSETLHDRSSNADETKCNVIDTDTDSDTEHKKPAPPAVEKLFLNDGSEYPITQELLDEFSSLYPAVNVPQELRSMRGWCVANPSKRKTKTGILRFVNAWLAREQDKGQPGLALGPMPIHTKPRTRYDIENERQMEDRRRAREAAMA